MTVANRSWMLEPDTPGAHDALDRDQARRRAIAASRLDQANLLALLLPAALLAGAWGFQLIGGLVPCEMCHWQRWPHYAALAVAASAFAARNRPPAPREALVVLAALLIAASGLIGVAHVGVERHWWDGFTACTASTSITGATAAERLDSLLRQPIVRCDVPQWTLLGISMAGFNAIISLGGALAILLRSRKIR